ncbi:UNVERIFIED_CONTAM: LINE-1 retrotransposable element O protein [Sesamum latifolium]|uniref:LINE-1 retrotransposable element O protein n=1 Tax=Sesamum latifolium TaxID=2727402 RepID=A0AAW2WTB4_9LAMI
MLLRQGISCPQHSNCINDSLMTPSFAGSREFVDSTTGLLLTEQEDVTKEFVSYYKMLLGRSQHRASINLDHLLPFARYRLGVEEAQSLEEPVTKGEIERALFSMEDDKAPGPDGYSAIFFKKAWAMVGPEVIAAVQEFFTLGRLLKQLNTTLLCLIPKVEMSHGVGDFRPIACCNVFYKIITKILVARMSAYMGKLVSNNQNAFVPRRCISENIMIAQELFTGYNQRRFPPSCALKVDLKKAFDSVEWDFLRATLQIFNFPPRFVAWILECVTTVSYSISLNGGPYGFFKGERGLRQGDPLSPFLFVLIMEMLNLIIRARIRNSGLFSFHWRCKELEIAMLSFADDLLLFSEADVNSITLFKDALMEFSDASGLEANPSKSVILLSKSAADMSTSIQTVLNFQIGLLPVKYLGAPINSSRITLADCAPLIAKMDKRLQGWSSYRLSFAARVQLIRSVLCSLSVYWSSSFILPKGVIKILEMKIRQFLWKGTNGTGYAKALNQALISKHVWDILQNKESSIWVQWVRTYKLRNKSIWEIPTASSTWSWKKILSLCRKLTPMLEFQIATGTKFWLWKDPWHPIGILSLLFPRAPTVTVQLLQKFLGMRCFAVLSKYQEISSSFGSRFLTNYLRGIRCLIILKERVKFGWPFIQWNRGVEWGTARYRGKHLITAAYRATLASLVYHIWRERNSRRFYSTSSSPEAVSSLVVEQVRLRILSEGLPPSIQSYTLFRIWNIDLA